MRKFNDKNYVKNLPDFYLKTETSNNYKLLSINKAMLDGLKTDIDDIFNALDIDQATGETLDLYGEMYNQPRGYATDAQYRLLIKSKIMQNISGGDYKSVVKAICGTFNCSPSEVLIREVEGKPCAIELAVLPVDVINAAGLTISQTVAIIERLLPAGVRLEQYSFEGTFVFADDYTQTNDKGFASDDGTIEGGYLGTIGYSEDAPILPT